MHKYSLEDRVHHVLDFILVLLKLQTEKHQFTLGSGTNAKLQEVENRKSNVSSALKREQVSPVSDTPQQKSLAHLLSLLQQQFQLLVRSFADDLVPLGLVLSLGVVLVNTQVQCHIH